MNQINQKLIISSESFKDNGQIPKRHTGFGEDMSPSFKLDGLSSEAVSIVIIMDDLDITFIKEYNHWIIWNITPMSVIPENIPYGPVIPSLNNAKQGLGYGKNRYRGPKQPFFIRKEHKYIFKFYVLDDFLSLDSNIHKNDLINSMSRHIIQEGSIIGKYKR